MASSPCKVSPPAGIPKRDIGSMIAVHLLASRAVARPGEPCAVEALGQAFQARATVFGARAAAEEQSADHSAARFGCRDFSLEGGMSPQHTDHQRAGLVRPLAVAAFMLAVLVTAAVGVAVNSNSSAESTARARVAALVPGEQGLADSQTFSPGESAYEGDEAVGEGAQDWFMHASPAANISLAAVTASRQDWMALKARGDLEDTGHWTNLGPNNAVYPLNPYRNRTV